MKKKLALILTGVLGGIGLYLYKNKTKKKNVVDERSLAKDNNDYVVYHDDDSVKSDNEEMFV